MESIRIANQFRLVQSLFAAFGRGDIDFILSHIAEDATWNSPGPSAIPSAGRYSGPAGVADFFRIDGGKVTHWETYYDTAAYALAHS